MEFIYGHYDIVVNAETLIINVAFSAVGWGFESEVRRRKVRFLKFFSAHFVKLVKKGKKTSVKNTSRVFDSL